MAKPYSITITNGEGTANVLNDSYSVTANVTGYQNTSIDPNSVTVVEGTNSYAFTISAEGALTLHVTDTGLAGGTPVVGAKFIRCDSEGNTYGNEVTTDQQGSVILPNLPYDASNAPVVYYKQTASDDDHTFDSSLKNIQLTSSTLTVEVSNPVPALRTFTLNDKNYSGLAISSGTITLS